MSNDELNESERATLDAWASLAPPADFADRVLAAREAPPTRRRWILPAVAAVAAAATITIVLTRPHHAASGQLVATTRTTRALGDRAVAVAEADSALTWNIDDDGDAVIEQRAGDVFYRVERGGSFIVHTDVADVRVTGTCFRIEVNPMNRTKQLFLSGTVGAAIAAGVVVTVYEGHVLADSKTGHRAEVVAGSQATVDPAGTVVVRAATPAPDIALDETTATREQLIARTQQQTVELTKLRARVAQLEHGGGGDVDDRGGAEPGRAWNDPSDERLKAWAAECHVRNDEPGFDRWQPITSVGSNNERGIEPSELPAINAALAEVQQQWKALLRALYIEATGDLAGADSLSLEAMRREIEEKGSSEENDLIRQRIANERAGLAEPPADLSKTTPFERMFRAYLALGDQAEQAIAKRLGADRAKAIRGDAWGSRSDWSGCPKP